MANAKRARRTLKASDKTLEPYAPAVSLSPSERREIANQRALDKAADTEAALNRPAELTPLQLKRLAYSEAKKAALKAKKAERQQPETN
jgi:hypothetical protein